jgi:hypothetical protein
MKIDNVEFNLSDFIEKGAGYYVNSNEDGFLFYTYLPAIDRYLITLVQSEKAYSVIVKEDDERIKKLLGDVH